MNTHTIPTDRHEFFPQLSRRAIAFVAVLALSLTLLGPTVQPAEAQVRGGVTASCQASHQHVRVVTQTNASQHMLFLRRWDGQRWVLVRLMTTSATHIFFNVSPGHYRLDVLGYTSTSGWQYVWPVRYESTMASWATPFRISNDYCTLRPYYY